MRVVVETSSVLREWERRQREGNGGRVMGTTPPPPPTAPPCLLQHVFGWLEPIQKAISFLVGEFENEGKEQGDTDGRGIWRFRVVAAK